MSGAILRDSSSTSSTSSTTSTRASTGALTNPFTDPGVSIRRMTDPRHHLPSQRAATTALRSSIPLYDGLADSYDAHFAVPHRRAYDDLAWEMVLERLPPPPATVIDAGCGSGRWALRLTELGHHVIGIEQAPQMAAAARRRLQDYDDRFHLVEEPMETADRSALLPNASAGADLVLAMGSMQYTVNPAATLARLAQWVRPGGHVMVLTDSLVALVQELLDAGETTAAVERLETRRGVWIQQDCVADLHLMDAARLRVDAANAGLENVTVHGLLSSWSTMGRAALIARLESDWDAALATERRLAQDPLMADLGKQLLMIGQTASAQHRA